MNWQTYGRMLAHEGLVADPLLPARDRDTMPWYLKLLAGFGAWLAALFVLGALGAASFWLLDSASARGGLGLAACSACAWAVRRGRREAGSFRTQLLAQFLTALSLAGAALIVSMVLDWGYDLTTMLAAGALVAAGLLVVNPEPVHRLLMALAMAGCLALSQWGLHPVASVLFALATGAVWLKQVEWTVAGLGPLLAPVGMACAAALLLLPAWRPLGAFSPVSEGAQPHLAWLEPAGLALALAVVIVRVARDLPRRADAPPRGWFMPAAVAATAAVAAAAWQAPGIIACLLVWVLGVTAGRALLANLALCGLACYLLQLYYSLDTSLLGKGVSLLSTGAVLLMLHLAIAYRRKRA